MKYLSHLKQQLLRYSDDPKTAAHSFTLGVALAFCPFPGLHMVLGFVLAKYLRLNWTLILVGTLVHNPWTFLFIHLGGVIAGDLALYQDLRSLDAFHEFPWGSLTIRHIFSPKFWSVNWPILRTMIWPFFVGHMLFSLVSIFPTYFGTIRMLKKSDKQKQGEPQNEVKKSIAE